MNNKEQESNFDFETFNDVENKELRVRNRAVVMANIWEDHSDGKKLSPLGTKLLFTYFNNVPEEEKKVTFDTFKSHMTVRGFVPTSVH